MSLRRSPVLLLAASFFVLPLVACGDDSATTGSGGGGASSSSDASGSTGDGATTTSSGGGEGGSGHGGSGGAGPTTGTGGAGGGPDLDKDPADVTTPEACFYEGGGGANGFECNAVVVELDPPVALAQLTFRVETSEGDVFEAPYDPESPEGLGVRPEGDPVTALHIRIDSPPPHYAPSWVDVEVRNEGTFVGGQRFEDLSYTCIAKTSDDWCWEAAPLSLPLTNPE